MRALVHNRIELVEAYALARRPMDARALDRIVAALVDILIAAAQAHFRAGVEVLLHADGRAGRGHGPAFRLAVQTADVAAWFPRGRTLVDSAADAQRRGKLFVRDVISRLEGLLGTSGKALRRREHRRKAPGKLADLIERIAPAEMLKVERFAELAAKEREWLSDDIANLRRSVHSEAVFSRLMRRLRSETQVAFLPAATVELTTLGRKMVGVPIAETRLHRRRRMPRFAGTPPERPVGVIAVKCRLDRVGAQSGRAYYSD
jgi:hypothetical protein